MAAKDEVRLQGEIPATTERSETSSQKFEIATSKGDPETLRTLDRATIGAHNLLTFKKPVLLTDRYHPWFERLRNALQRDRDGSPYVRQLPSPITFDRQRAGRYEKKLLRKRDFMRYPITRRHLGK